MPAAASLDDELLAGARRALEEHGWAGATLERIAAEAAVSRMTLHRRGVTRDAVVAALAARLAADHREAMLGPLCAPGTARERLELALRADLELCERDLALLDALSAAEHAAIHHEHDGEGAVRTRPAFVDPLARLLRDGAQDGSLRAHADPDETATVLANLVGPTYRHLRTAHGWAPGRAADAVVALALDGVA